MNLKSAFALFGLLGVCAVSSAQVTKVGSAYQFRLKLAKGTVYKYNMTVSQKAAGAQGGGFNIKVPFSQKVVSLSGANATVAYSAGPILINGQPLNPKPTTGTAVISKTGKVVNGSQAAGQGVAVFPEKPIAPGSTWSANIPLSGLAGGGNSTAKATYKFVGVKSVAGKQVAQLAVTLTGSGQTKVSGTGTTYVLLADGAPLKSDLTLKISGAQVQNGTAPPMTMNLVVNRA